MIIGSGMDYPGVMWSNLKTGSSEFFTWWYEGILLCVPRRLREKLLRRPDRILIRRGDQRITLELVPGGAGQAPRQQAFLIDSARAAPTEVVRWIKEHASNAAHICLVVETSTVLHKELALPLAGEAELHELLRFEMDRQTPFSADQVYYGYRIRSRDRKSGKLHLDLFVLPRHGVDPLLMDIRGEDIPLHAILMADDNGAYAEINLLPPAERSLANGGPDRNTLFLALICGLFFLAALYLPGVHRQRSLDAMEQQLDAVRQQTREVQPLLDERDRLLQRGRFLLEKQQGHIPVIALLEELTRILPDDTWINRLVYQDKEIQLYGESATETGLLQILESSAYFHGANFRSPVTYNNTTGKNNFHISAIPEKEPDS